MSLLTTDNCRTAILVGLHYRKPRFSLANFFNEILDAVSDLDNFEAQSVRKDEIIFKVGKIKVALSTQALIINSPIVVDEQLKKHLSEKEDRSGQYFYLPTSIYGQKFLEHQTLSFHKEDSNKFRRNFLSECVEMVKLLDKIAQGLPNLRFIGIVEYYAVPLNAVTWNILESFKKQAHIKGSTNTEKKSINRYYFPKTEKVDERCFVFNLTKPDDHKNPEAIIAGASFDFQYIPEKPKSVAEYGGPKSMINSLATGVEELTRDSEFLKFSDRS